MWYPSIQEIKIIHDRLVGRFGGLPGLHNLPQLESVLGHIQNDTYYPSFVEKATHLFFGIIQFHCFNDGNKRTAVFSLDIFLSLNGYQIENSIIKMEDIAVWVAKGEIGKPELEKILRSMLLSFGYEV